MPPFGPDIERMKENRDIASLSVLLRSENVQTQIEATEALLELNDPSASEEIAKRYARVLRGGDIADKIELMMIMQGRASFDTYLAWVPDDVDEARKLRLMRLTNIAFKKKADVAFAQSALLGLAKDASESHLIRLLAIVTLVDLGERSQEVLETLFDLIESFQEWNVWIVNEAARALSSFGSVSEVAETLISIQKGEMFPGRGEKQVPVREAAIFALGASNCDAAREYLEYLVSSGDSLFMKQAQVALSMFGTATYDQ